MFDLVPPYALTDGVGEAFRRGGHLSQTSLVNYRLTEHVLIYTSGKSSVADRGGGVLGSATPFLAHDVGFLTLGPKARPPPPLRGDLKRWTPPPSKILHSSYIAQISSETFNLNVNLESKNVYNKKAKSNLSSHPHLGYHGNKDFKGKALKMVRFEDHKTGPRDQIAGGTFCMRRRPCPIRRSHFVLQEAHVRYIGY